jgi:hypothetical protein
MSDIHTPGQRCYEAYCLVIFGERPDLSHDYDGLAERTQQAWEAAAQAVQDAGPACLLCGTRLILQRCTRFEDPHWIGCLSCEGIGYVVRCPGTHTDALTDSPYVFIA